jgi:2-polyprenyl-3-methyl-5-hydroxy-6-metoxy-1,4-benzoquinol methylase
MPVTAAEVRLAYLLLLNREPESTSAIQGHVDKYASSSLAQMRQDFMNSPEYRSNNPDLIAALAANYARGPKQIDVNVSSELLGQLVARVIDQWSKLGEADPYWSVLTHDEFRSENIHDDALRNFYATGAENADLVDIFEARAGVRTRRDSCFELGCGVGRVTQFLAGKFERVIAADISPGNLKLCAEYMRSKGIGNVETMLIESPEQLKRVEPFGFFYSIIVLQHNAPPVQKLFLDNLLPKILPGGGCLFQTPDEFLDYSFNAREFLAQGDAKIDTHCLPRSVVLKIIQDHGLRVLDVVPDSWLGPMLGSYTYSASMPG